MSRFRNGCRCRTSLTGESDVSPRPSAGGVVAAEVPAGTVAQTHRIPVGNRAATGEFDLSALFSGADIFGSGTARRVIPMEAFLVSAMFEDTVSQFGNMRAGSNGVSSLLSSLMSGGGWGNPACLGCSGGAATSLFSRQSAVLDAELAALVEKQTHTNTSIADLTAEVEALDADKTSLVASLEELQGKLADIQAKTKRIERLQAALTATQAEIDAIPGRRMALETAQASEAAAKRAVAQARAAEKAKQEAEAAARDVGVKQLFLGQLASDPWSIVLDVESLSSTRQHMAVVQALLQAGNEVTLKLTLAPLAVPSSVSVSDDTAVAPVDDKEGGAVDSDKEDGAEGDDD